MENWLVIGSGGREYSIAQCLAKKDNHHVYVAPGNPMMERMDNVHCVQINEMNFNDLTVFAQSHRVVCTIVGPEQPLSNGIVDVFKKSGIKIFGPDQYTAQLESSKVFAKDMMQKASIPTADYQEFYDTNSALAYVDSHNLPLVIKANGLAGGKDVIIVNTKSQATNAINHLFSLPNQQSIIIEEYLDGEEFSFIVMANGEKFIPMPLAQDHKRLMNNDEGPNTGGMGAYSPLPQFGKEVTQNAINKVIKPLLSTMVNEGHPFVGFLYAGLIMTKQGIKVIEFNVRMGDPETQVILPQLKSDLGDLIVNLLDGKKIHVKWDASKYYLGTVLAAKGYPKKPSDHLELPKFPDGTNIIYSGVQDDNGLIYSHGGRVLMVTTKSNNILNAQHQINELILKSVNQNNYLYRSDIGLKAIK
ncbi:phosphoribosylamine--glycine ligase [Apilactobacillus micheneri]|uniref:Phosphoribosylamine--glycine ligase n=1 Tax=Apilactobacillus micheneri TaxID=1899430 RepID=A0A9Q8MTZ2_9LACO|nr:phosphoribosylamine--glycine ligase [Apilactobacillus micheneri]TPR40639.1 phosphoribosylamine--glycine ligase [Apilactobacillus micheneri]TPR45060.1 phosphoribosylamine--glycine ligase [Apilactobacillus micheneri]TPR46402.1 phosphoribosylamine--glycine ligase [Apilactobacillus micheneri]